MNSDKSYTDSHTMEWKGAQYKEHYDTDRWYRSLWLREQKALKDIVETYFKGRQIHLLDFACGTGRICGFLEPWVADAVGVDVSQSMLDIAGQNLKRTKLIRADITNQPVLAGRKFNLITAFRFFLNAEPALRKAALRAIVPLLATDGLLVFNNHRNRTSPLVRLKYGRRHKTRNFMSMREMREMVNEFGLNIVRIYPVGFLPLPGIKLPPAANNIIDGFASRFKCLSDYSESPIAVCRLA
jgi:predicted TPR repeat methyltransferase